MQNYSDIVYIAKALNSGYTKKKKKRSKDLSARTQKKQMFIKKRGYTGIRHQAPRWAYKKGGGGRSRHRTQTSPEDQSSDDE